RRGVGRIARGRRGRVIKIVGMGGSQDHDAGRTLAWVVQIAEEHAKQAHGEAGAERVRRVRRVVRAILSHALPVPLRTQELIDEVTFTLDVAAEAAREWGKEGIREVRIAREALARLGFVGKGPRPASTKQPSLAPPTSPTVKPAPPELPPTSPPAARRN